MNLQSSLLLDLSKAPSTLFLFGLAGSGKSFIGDLIGELAGWHVYHADDDLLPEMKQALEHRQPFTPLMRASFFRVISQKIRHLQSVHKCLVVTQAVYKQEHRNYLQTTIPNMEMLLVDASDTIIVQRIDSRDTGINKHSAAALREDFEHPDTQYVKVITNESNKVCIVQQLNHFYGSHG